ncbi:indole-3-glycerol phosphate synthase TrpC [Anaeromyxobacter paludicola]|uniref:Indole-3-glycerol phosphate synthase n=1 Tax=Anaeromyxobacter paludicola TaxID=2918171 RepID=A0ABM7XBZ1_9BACT|nr:indole-3-glycerol phosphate synthase TrpC [Anaeromyxobacter paludicola]BDG09387.1 indole-3-glycerol phosphate synthase 1 [Anaeromyxobacter paludicola]
MSFLGEILCRKAAEVEERRRKTSERELITRASDLPPPRSLAEALSPRGGPVRVVAEVKRASPSAGEIAAALDAPAQAARYAAGGAAAVSILTDGPGFGGALEDLAGARRQVALPLLRKDFVIDRYQLLEARVAGADAALLIAAALSEDGLAGLVEDCAALQLTPLVEVHDEWEVEAALAAGAQVVGVNNRNLKTMKVDLSVSERLLPMLPETVKAVAESGVRTAEDVRRLRAAGAANFLVGEALVRAADPAALLKELMEA